MLELMTVLSIGICLSVGVLLVAIWQEHPIRNGLKGTMVPNTIRNRHLDSSRVNLSQMSQRKLSSIEQREANHDDQIIV